MMESGVLGTLAMDQMICFGDKSGLPEDLPRKLDSAFKQFLH
jgi:hypothetical protein